MDKKWATLGDLVRLQKFFDCYHEDADSKALCGACPLSSFNNGERLACTEYIGIYPDEASDAILKWCEEHKPKTYADDFFEKFPNAKKDSNGTPFICRGEVYGEILCTEIESSDFEKENYCKRCWEQQMEVEE